MEDIDIELGEVCTAITKYAMSNKNCEIEVEKHELTSMTSGATAPPENSNKANSKTPEEDVDVGFITQIDKDGNIQQVPIKFEGDQEEEANPLAMAGKKLKFWGLLSTKITLDDSESSDVMHVLKAILLMWYLKLCK